MSRQWLKRCLRFHQRDSAARAANVSFWDEIFRGSQAFASMGLRGRTATMERGSIETPGSLRKGVGEDILSTSAAGGRVELFVFDEAYFRRLRDREPLTESHFVAYFSDLLHIKLRARFISSQAIEDITQETFMRVLKALRSETGIREPERLGAFVNSVCNNVLMEFYRSSSRTEQADENTPEPPDRTIDLEGFLVTKQTCQHVRKVLQQLPAKDKRLLRALFLEDKDKDEICREFGVDRDYFRVLLHRAKESFKAMYRKSAQAAGGKALLFAFLMYMEI
jgi:RNA polymerase sigma-70 factor (ECF subfamily)